jgi:nucleolin
MVNYMAKTRGVNKAKNPPSKTLFIGNLAFEMTDQDLNKLFRDIANVIDVRVAIDRRTGQPRGFAHADFTDVESAQKAAELLEGKEVYNRGLRIDFSMTPGRTNPSRSDSSNSSNF